MKMIYALSILAWWLLAAIVAALFSRLVRSGFDPEPRPVRYISVSREPEQPRRVSIQLATGGVEILRPKTEPDVHGDGSELDRSWR